jgi:hypothetical protein
MLSTKALCGTSDALLHDCGVFHNCSPVSSHLADLLQVEYEREVGD